jgi:peptidoglycan LD-endopeptidase CwlK
MSSYSLNDLRPEFRARVDLWEGDMKASGIDHHILCTLRSGVEQDALWEEGRSIPGPHVDAQHPMGHVVTHARAGQSPHQYGLAFDFVIMRNGKPDWSGDSEAWNDAIELALNRGLESLRPMESAHLQMPNWKSLIGTHTA